MDTIAGGVDTIAGGVDTVAGRLEVLAKLTGVDAAISAEQWVLLPQRYTGKDEDKLTGMGLGGMTFPTGMHLDIGGSREGEGTGRLYSDERCFSISIIVDTFCSKDANHSSSVTVVP